MVVRRAALAAVLAMSAPLAVACANSVAPDVVTAYVPGNDAAAIEAVAAQCADGYRVSVVRLPKEVRNLLEA